MPEERTEEMPELVEFPAVVKCVSEDGGKSFVFVAEGYDNKGALIARREIPVRHTEHDVEYHAEMLRRLREENQGAEKMPDDGEEKKPAPEEE